MATISPTWTENVAVRASATLASGASDTNDIDLDNLSADRSDIQVNITIGSASSVTVEFFGSSDSGTTDDTTPLHSYVVTVNDTRTISMTGPYVAVKLTNNDGGNATGNIVIDHAWRQWTSV